MTYVYPGICAFYKYQSASRGPQTSVAFPITAGNCRPVSWDFGFDSKEVLLLAREWLLPPAFAQDAFFPDGGLCFRAQQALARAKGAGAKAAPPGFGCGRAFVPCTGSRSTTRADFLHQDRGPGHELVFLVFNKTEVFGSLQIPQRGFYVSPARLQRDCQRV